MRIAFFKYCRHGALAMMLNGLVSPPGYAASPTCPDEISVSQKISANVPGFTASDKGIPHRLENIEFSSGPPDQQGWLAPSSSTATHSTWDFLPTDSIFLSCDFGYTSLILSRPLPPHTQSCKVQFDPTFSPPVATGVTCR
jgi:hypothetical protein